ncbi:MAG: DUF2865 domain-containing protein [Mesorhizobium sp.]
MAARMQGLKRFVAMIAAIAVCLVLHTGAALADERLCRQLEAQLAALSPGGGGGAQYRKYDKAIATQRDQLRQTRGRARASGCGFSLLGGGGGSGCARLNRTIDRMERNLSALQSKRTQLAGAGGMKRQRNRLLASLDANGCRDTRAQQREARRSLEQTSRGMTLFDRLFNGGVRPLEELEAEIPDNVRRVPSDEWQASGGQYRTLCVRTCDGYYFPISPSSSMRDFDRDQQNCEAMCPGTEAQIYYQDAAEESAETMLSTATGAPYADLPTAFLYRQARPAQCGCNPAKNFSIIAGTPPADELPAIDPDAATAAAPPTEGSITTFGEAPASPAVEPPPPAEVTTLPPPGERKVRVVGPVFLPDQEGAIDLRAPARSGAR